MMYLITTAERQKFSVNLSQLFLSGIVNIGKSVGGGSLCGGGENSTLE